jgi:hypothetical protein
LAKAKKAEKALADANKEHLQREQAVVERLNTISEREKPYIVPFFFFYFLIYLFSYTFLYVLLWLLSIFLVLQNTLECLCQFRSQTAILS